MFLTLNLLASLSQKSIYTSMVMVINIVPDLKNVSFLSVPLLEGQRKRMFSVKYASNTESLVVHLLVNFSNNFVVEKCQLSSAYIRELLDT